MVRSTDMLAIIVHTMLPMFVTLHAFLLMWYYVPEIGVCDDLPLPRLQGTSDVTVALDRQGRSYTFNLASVLEIVTMVMILFFARSAPKKLSLAGAARWLPMVLIIDALVLRGRHIGLGACAPHDSACCDNLNCPDTAFTTTLAGCASATSGMETWLPIKWGDRTSYCPLAPWYVNSNALELCRGLAGTPDVASCYRYGCSSVATPVMYYSVRIITFNVVVFALLSLAARSPLHATAGHAHAL